MMSQPFEQHVVCCAFRRHRAVRFAKGLVSSFLTLLLAVLLLSALNASPSTAGSVPCDCQTCHGDFHGENWQGCSACHPSPPPTGSHLAHYNSAPLTSLRYGDTGVNNTADAYIFGCGNCHPLAPSQHRDGSVEVELYDPLAPPGSIKAKNPSNATYDPGAQTCSNVYCHSGPTVASSVVGTPLTSPPDPVPPGYTLNGSYIMDGTCSNLTYAPYTVDSARAYATTPSWGTTGTFTACTECHAFPPTTYYPTVDAGVGDSHQWIDASGYTNLHAWNMSYFAFGAVPCMTCHYGTVTQTGATQYTYANGKELIVYDPVPLSSRVTHVNGASDVAFDTVNGFQYRNPYDLSGATYDPYTKTCSNVACHYNPTAPPSAQALRWQENAKWGAPYRWESSTECDLCHR